MLRYELAEFHNDLECCGRYLSEPEAMQLYRRGGIRIWSCMSFRFQISIHRSYTQLPAGMVFLYLFREAALIYNRRRELRFQLRPKLHAPCLIDKSIIAVDVARSLQACKALEELLRSIKVESRYGCASMFEPN